MKPIEPIIVSSMPEFCALISLAYAIGVRDPSFFISTCAYITFAEASRPTRAGRGCFVRFAVAVRCDSIRIAQTDSPQFGGGATKPFEDVPQPPSSVPWSYPWQHLSLGFPWVGDPTFSMSQTLRRVY